MKLLINAGFYNFILTITLLTSSLLLSHNIIYLLEVNKVKKLIKEGFYIFIIGIYYLFSYCHL